MEKTEQKEKDGTIVTSLKTSIEELADYLGEMEISGAAFFIGIDNKSKKICSALARVDVPANKDNPKSAAIRMFDHEYLKKHETVEMLKYGEMMLYVGHDKDDFVIRVGKDEKETTGGEEDV